MSKERFDDEIIPTYLIQSAVQKYLFGVKHLKGNVVLDIASGIGYGSKIMYDKKPHMRFFGCDNDKNAISFANKKYGEFIKFLNCSAYSTGFDDYFFDSIVSFETLEHLNNGESFMKEITRILKKDGILILSTPNRTYDEKVDKDTNPYHEIIYSKNDLYQLLSNHFKYVQILGQKESFSEIMFKFPFLYEIFKKIKPILLPFFIRKNNNKITDLPKLNSSFEPRPFWDSATYLIALASNQPL
jgi:ubiquinone/menaquinone biosynthesis C-methylase UbiE